MSKMKLYSIVDADLSRLEEICLDIKRQYDEDIANCPLFYVKLVPEGDPPVDKATLFAERYIPFRDRLAEMGLACGILVQCTIGHGYVLENMNPFTQYENLTDGKKQYIVCPYDEDARAYFKDQFKKLGALHPADLMVDGDFRLMCRAGMGCACPLHMRAFHKKTGTDIDRATLYSILTDKKHPKQAEYEAAFVETQRESLVDAMKLMREGLDESDPNVHGVCCNGGSSANEFADEFAKIIAGKGHPSGVRVGNGNYCYQGARGLSTVSYRFAQEGGLLKRDGVDMVFEEGDTCPHNRYSTSAAALHTHHVISILEGAMGTKHWLTRLDTNEPASGEAYRRKLATYAPMYEKLNALYPTLTRIGCRIPLPTKKEYGFTKKVFDDCWWHLRDAWSKCVLECFGLPLYFSYDIDGATFLEGDSYLYSDEDVLEMLKRPLFLASDSAKELCERGFGEHLGVKVEELTDTRACYERIGKDRKRAPAQMRRKTLLPTSPDTAVDSVLCRMDDDGNEIDVGAAVTVYKNTLGGMVVCFSGTPLATHIYYEAFSFLTESRKAQIVRLLREANALPVYYVGDDVIYLTAADMAEGGRLVALYSMGFDPVEEICLCVDTIPERVERLTKDGVFVPVDFTVEGENIRIKHPLFLHDTLILALK
ncbi:MAG: hypothetical protein J6S44_02425 [Clostridia bacterium]|nr:hypothetical protein [Clostridia bacterium]